MLAHAAVGVYRFEDLRVWQAAKQQCDPFGALLKRPQFLGDRELSSQISDASLSVMFNISERISAMARQGDVEVSAIERIARMLRRWQATLEPGQPPRDRTQDSDGRRTQDGPRT